MVSFSRRLRIRPAIANLLNFSKGHASRRAISIFQLETGRDSKR
jgi:hypothetical protein